MIIYTYFQPFSVEIEDKVQKIEEKVEKLWHRENA